MLINLAWGGGGGVTPGSFWGNTLQLIAANLPPGGGSTGRGEAIIKIKFACKISVGMLLECVMTAKMAEASQFNLPFLKFAAVFCSVSTSRRKAR